MFNSYFDITRGYFCKQIVRCWKACHVRIPQKPNRLPREHIRRCHVFDRSRNFCCLKSHAWWLKPQSKCIVHSILALTSSPSFILDGQSFYWAVQISSLNEFRVQPDEVPLNLEKTPTASHPKTDMCQCVIPFCCVSLMTYYVNIYKHIYHSTSISIHTYLYISSSIYITICEMYISTI